MRPPTRATYPDIRDMPRRIPVEHDNGHAVEPAVDAIPAPAPPPAPEPSSPPEPDIGNGHDALARLYQVRVEVRDLRRRIPWHRRAVARIAEWGNDLYRFAGLAEHFLAAVIGGRATPEVIEHRREACAACHHNRRRGWLHAGTHKAAAVGILASVATIGFGGVQWYWAAAAGVMAAAIVSWAFLPAGAFCSRCECWSWRPARLDGWKPTRAESTCPAGYWDGKKRRGCGKCGDKT